MNPQLSKILDQGARFAWIIFILALLLLFLPDEILKSSGMLSLRNNNVGLFYLLFIISGSLWLGKILPELYKKLKK